MIGTWQKILKLSGSGQILQELQFTVSEPKFQPAEMDCFIILKAEGENTKDEVSRKICFILKWTVTILVESLFFLCSGISLFKIVH